MFDRELIDQLRDQDEINNIKSNLTLNQVSNILLTLHNLLRSKDNYLMRMDLQCLLEQILKDTKASITYKHNPGREYVQEGTYPIVTFNRKDYE